MADDCERALASTGRRGRVSWPGRPGPVRPGHRARTAVRWPALPIADAAGLTAAAAVSGGGREVRGRVLCALYLIGVLVTLAAGQMHRLRICLRVADQAGRVLIAMAVPAIALLAWLPAARVLWLATWSGGLVLACRALLYTALRAAPRRDLPVAALGGTADLAGVVRRLGIQRVIVCFSSACRDEDLVTVMRASRPLRTQVYVVPRLDELGIAVPRGCLDEIWGVPLIPLRSSERARFDNYYAEYWSIWLDLVILARTFATVLRGIWAAGEPEDRRGARAGGREAR